MKEEDKSKLVEVFTGSPWEAELVKSLLGNSDIEAVTKDGMVANPTQARNKAIPISRIIRLALIVV